MHSSFTSWLLFFFTIFIIFLTSPLSHYSLPLFIHHVEFQMENRYSQFQKKEADFSELIFFFPSSLSHFPDFPLPSSLFLPLSLPLVQYQMEMMRSLRHVNIDHLHVGWYQSTYYGSFVSRALLDSQFSYQHAIEESVVLIYGE